MTLQPRLSPLQWDIGSQISYEGNLSKTFYNAISQSMYSFQFFLGNPKSFTRGKVTQQDIEQAVNWNKRFPTHVISHAPLVYNLNGKKDCLAWNGDEEQDNKTSYIISQLEYELGVLANFTEKSNGVVVHPGNYPDRQIGLDTIAKTINKIDFPENSKLLLENSAGQGTSLATTLAEIKHIIDGVESKKNIGVCIDTCHLFAYGEYDISRCDELDRFFHDFDRIIGMDKFSLVHLNDSKTPLKSRKDRHELLEQGHIWGKDNKSLIYLLNKCKANKIPLVLETNPTDMETLNKLATMF